MNQYLDDAQGLSVPKLQKPDPWDVGLVLQALRREPFEPMERTDMKWVSVKMAVLLSLLTVARGKARSLTFLWRTWQSLMMIVRS